MHVLDPFGVSGLPGAAYNPLDRLTPESPDLGEDAAALAEALVMDPPGQVSEALQDIARDAERPEGAERPQEELRNLQSPWRTREEFVGAG